MIARQLGDCQAGQPQPFIPENVAADSCASQSLSKLQAGGLPPMGPEVEWSSRNNPPKQLHVIPSFLITEQIILWPPAAQFIRRPSFSLTRQSYCHMSLRCIAAYPAQHLHQHPHSATR